MSSSKTSVTVRIADLQGELEIVDGDFRVIKSGFGELTTDLPPGIYKARARAGDAQREELFAVEPDAAPFEVPVAGLSFASPVPLRDTNTKDKDHQRALVEATKEQPADVGLGEGATLLFSLRDPFCASLSRLGASPAERESCGRSCEGFRLRSFSGELLADFDSPGKYVPDSGFKVLNLQLKPGAYVLCYEPESKDAVAMPVQAVEHWQTQVFIQVEPLREPGAVGCPNLAERAVMMAEAGKAFQPDDASFRLVEMARHALIQGRPAVPRDQLDKMLREKFINPMLGLFAAHLLLLESEPQLNLIRTVIENVGYMVGEAFPDVLALRIAFAELNGDRPDIRSDDLSFPPLLRASWDYIARRAELMPPGSVQREAAGRLVAQGPWLAWKPVAPLDIDVVDLTGRLLRHKKVLSILSVKKFAGMVDDIHALLRDGEVHTDLARQEDGSVALEIVTSLARKIPWTSLFGWLKAESAEHGLLSQLTALQKTLLPTLQLIRAQLEDGEDFTLDDLRELGKGLGVTLPVLRESLEDLAKIIVPWGASLLVKKITEEEGATQPHETPET